MSFNEKVSNFLGIKKTEQPKNIEDPAKKIDREINAATWQQSAVKAEGKPGLAGNYSELNKKINQGANKLKGTNIKIEQ